VNGSAVQHFRVPRIVLRFAARSFGDFFLGDYMGIAATAGAAHLVWARAARSDHEPHQTIWSAAVRRS
jgi:hypothetical protein